MMSRSNCRNVDSINSRNRLKQAHARRLPDCHQS